MRFFIPSIVTAITLLLASTSSWAQPIGSPEWEKAQTPVKEVRKISNLKVSQKHIGRWFVKFDVDYSSFIPRPAEVQVAAIVGDATSQREAPFKSGSTFQSQSVRGQDGTRHMELELEFPMWVKNPGDRGDVNTGWQNGTNTDRVIVRLIRRKTLEDFDVLAEEVIEQDISWPYIGIWRVDGQIAKEGSPAVLKRAIDQIDNGDERLVREAKMYLERLLVNDSKLVQAYVELARVAMRIPGGPEGLHQAEALLNTAIKIDPNNANVLILRGHVYTMQRRHALAEADFTKAAATNPSNLWLWMNWGQSLSMQGKNDAALKMFRKTIEGPVSHESYDRARIAAFEQLVIQYEKQHDLQALNAIHQKRLQDYGLRTCHAADYALFKLTNYADADGAIELTRSITEATCNRWEPKDVLGMAYYVKWAQMKSGDRDSALQTARLSYPTGARLFYLLSGSDKTVDAAKQLVKTGELIDQSDNKRMTALAYAVKTQDTGVIGRLLLLGARPTTTVGYEAVPVALFPVFTGDLATITLMKKFGVDYTSLRYQGQTALDYARATGNNKLLEALIQKTPRT